MCYKLIHYIQPLQFWIFIGCGFLECSPYVTRKVFLTSYYPLIFLLIWWKNITKYYIPNPSGLLNWSFPWNFFRGGGALFDLIDFSHTDTINWFDEIPNNKMSIFCDSYYLRITVVETKQHDQKAGRGGKALFGFHFSY